MRKYILSAAFFVACIIPAAAADIGGMPDPATANWQTFIQSAGNLYKDLIMAYQNLAALQKQVADLIEKCGDRCAPVAQQAPAPEPPAAAVAPASPAKAKH